MTTDATGPDEIRAAFTTAIDTAVDQADAVNGLAALFQAATDRFQTRWYSTPPAAPAASCRGGISTTCPAPGGLRD